jgi:ABC-type uncharacterized transport system substrate-binding protein
VHHRLRLLALAPAADPLRLGLAESLDRPGGNVTGVSLLRFRTRLEADGSFREAVAGIRRIAVLVNAENPLHRFLLDDIQPTFRPSFQILIDAKVQAAVKTQAELEAVGELHLKGFRHPVQAFNVCKLQT